MYRNVRRASAYSCPSHVIDSRLQSDSKTRLGLGACAVSPTLGQKESSVRASSLLIVVANVNIGRWHSLGARRATRGGWRVSPNARPRSSPRSVETSWCPSGSPCASRPSSGARVDPRPVVSRVSLPTFHPSRLTPRPLALPPPRIGWLFKFFGLVGFATFLSPAFLRIAWMYYTDKQVRPLLSPAPPTRIDLDFQTPRPPRVAHPSARAKTRSRRLARATHLVALRRFPSHDADRARRQVRPEPAQSPRPLPPPRVRVPGRSGGRRARRVPSRHPRRERRPRG